MPVAGGGWFDGYGLRSIPCASSGLLPALLGFRTARGRDRCDDGGSLCKLVTTRWSRGAGLTRPKLAGGFHTIKFDRVNHVVLEGFKVTGGSRSCIFSEADDVVIRVVCVHDCPSGRRVPHAPQLSV